MCEKVQPIDSMKMSKTHILMGYGIYPCRELEYLQTEKLLSNS